jgi:hypothetical protein
MLDFTPSLSKDSSATEGAAIQLANLSAYITELKSNFFYSGNLPAMREALEKLLRYQRALWDKIETQEKSAENSADAELLTQTIQTLTKAIYNEEVIERLKREKSSPPIEFRTSLHLYFQHLYGLFPSTFLKYLNRESASNSLLRDIVKVFRRASYFDFILFCFVCNYYLSIFSHCTALFCFSLINRHFLELFRCRC